jgi:hypothetical protein
MKWITSDEFNTLCQDGEPIGCKGGYPAVVLHPDGRVTKIWARKKGFFSSSTLRPYSKRFIRNARELCLRGIVVPEILAHARVEGSHIRLVTYRSLPGESVRNLLENCPDRVDIPSLAQYIHGLHEKGILFECIHLGNVIQLPDHQGYGLIDFTDICFQKKPLNVKQRELNLSVPVRYKKDMDRIKEAGHPDLVNSYYEIS